MEKQKSTMMVLVEHVINALERTGNVVNLSGSNAEDAVEELQRLGYEVVHSSSLLDFSYAVYPKNDEEKL